MEDFEKQLSDAKSELRKIEAKLNHICNHATIKTPVHREAFHLLQKIRKVFNK